MSESSRILEALESKQYDRLIKYCQQVELDSHLSKVIHPSHSLNPLVLTSLLAAYLITDQIQKARFVTKRIPGTNQSSYLTTLTQITERLWFQDWEGAFRLLNDSRAAQSSNTSNDTRMETDSNDQRIQYLLDDALTISLRSRVSLVVAKAYESIPLPKLTSLLGFANEDQVLEYIHLVLNKSIPKPWTVSPDRQLVYPVRLSLDTVSTSSQSRPGLEFLVQLANYSMELEMK